MKTRHELHLRPAQKKGRRRKPGQKGQTQPLDFTSQQTGTHAKRGARIERADELCRALGITMTIGNTPTGDDATDVAGNDAASGVEQ